MIWMLLFWPRLWETIKQWVAVCPHCASYNVWRTCSSELHLSWPVTVPFWIIHVKLWSPGQTIKSSGSKISLLNCICDLTQFIVSSVVNNIDASSLAHTFMSDVVLTFGMCLAVVIYDCSSFKSTFILMCDALKINYWCLSRGNHCGNYVEHYHFFPKKQRLSRGMTVVPTKLYCRNQRLHNMRGIPPRLIMRTLLGVNMPLVASFASHWMLSLIQLRLWTMRTIVIFLIPPQGFYRFQSRDVCTTTTC